MNRILFKYKCILISGLLALTHSNITYAQIFRGGSGDGFAIDSISCHTTVITGVLPYVGGGKDGLGVSSTTCNYGDLIYFGGDAHQLEFDEVSCNNLDPGIFIGGENSGDDFIEITCVSTTASIYSGGSESGDDIGEVQCITLSSVIYMGGERSGQSYLTIDCVAPLLPAYLGGNNDGFGLDSLSCFTTIITGTLPYVGGTNDGSGRAEESCPITVNTTYYGGSNSGSNFEKIECDDGYALLYLGGVEEDIAMDEQTCIPYDDLMYEGGGYAGQEFTTIDCSPPIDPMYEGGAYDGYSMDSDGYPCATENTPLPITLFKFDANPVYTDSKVDVLCTWTTLSEANTNYFIIEKTKTFDQWDYVGNVSAIGFSSFAIDYDLLDYYPYDGISFYRLTSVDNDGTEEVFAHKKVNIGKQGEDILEIFPNPTNGLVNINVDLDIKDTGDLIITDLRGRVIDLKSFNFDESLGTITKDISSYPKGVYMISVKTDQTFITKRLINQ